MSMPKFNVWNQLPGKRVGDEYVANFRHMGIVEARNESEAMRIAKARGLSRAPIVQEVK